MQSLPAIDIIGLFLCISYRHKSGMIYGYARVPHQQREAIKRRDRGGELLADIGRSYNVSGATISRLTPCQTAGQVARAAQIRQLRAELVPATIAKKFGIARSSVYRALGAA